MKKSKAETAQTRQRIVETAAQAFKSKGISATGVAEVMSAVGMTHGGFYRHFSSKEQLVAEACGVAMDIMVDSTQSAATKGRASMLKQLDAFLSNEARDDAAGGCPLTAMGSELVRADADTRQVVTEGIVSMIQALEVSSAQADAKARKDDAIFTLSSLIGSLTLARIVDDPTLSDRILAIARARLSQAPAGGKQSAARRRAA